MTASSEVAPEELVTDASALIRTATDAGVAMRLLGGLAFYVLAPSSRGGPLMRRYRDFDVAVPAKSGPAATRILEASGLTPDKHFNALHGARRMIFESSKGYPVDVLIGTFQMCHRLEIEDGFDRHELVIAPSDLLLTKLQIAAIEPKDLADATALLLDLPVGSGAGTIEAQRFAAPLAEDWGFFHSVELNLDRVRTFAETTLERAGAAVVAERIAALASAMEAAPKSLRWRMRARVGERVAWYETPEEVG
ncbi:MAG TPA: hypothetical protein VEC15_03010 [Actinomycetota bacterium]|nr:hypothetical protein [Actinomycetota bacterium]